MTVADARLSDGVRSPLARVVVLYFYASSENRACALGAGRKYARIMKGTIYFSELLSLPNFRILPRTLTQLSAYAIAVYIDLYVYTSYNTMYMRRGFCTFLR